MEPWELPPSREAATGDGEKCGELAGRAAGVAHSPGGAAPSWLCSGMEGALHRTFWSSQNSIPGQGRLCGDLTPFPWDAAPRVLAGRQKLSRSLQILSLSQPQCGVTSQPLPVPLGKGTHPMSNCLDDTRGHRRAYKIS